ncbi:unnamed protein product [marine sediment metagenome]|uniref:Uncharacterized protein n=1 Tax=marine sediment metagenome TaxID=412755 RepID=X0YH87_9ZZZZ
MVLMHKASKPEDTPKLPVVDCRMCLHYPEPNTTGKSEDLLMKTDNWTHSFCGTDECENKEYTPVNGKTDSVDKGDTDGKEKNKKDTDNIESKS